MLNEARNAYAPTPTANPARLIEAHSALVRRIAWHVHSRMSSAIEVEDLIQIGLVALVEAAKNFEDRGIAFAPYAATRIRGNMVDALRRDTQARIVDLDGWTALPAFVPPNERRGLVLIDPPYENKDEFERLADGFTEAFVKWPTGTYLLWYPVKSRRATDTLARHVAAVAGASKPAGKCLRLEFSVAPQAADAGLTSAGLLIVNPPWTLAAELRAILPELEKPLGLGGAGRFRLETPKP